MCCVFSYIARNEHRVSPLLELAHMNVSSLPITVISSRRKPWPQFNLQTSGSDLFMRQSESMFFCLRPVFLDVMQMAHFSRIMLTLYCHLPLVIRRFH